MTPKKKSHELREACCFWFCIWCLKISFDDYLVNIRKRNGFSIPKCIAFHYFDLFEEVLSLENKVFPVFYINESTTTRIVSVSFTLMFLTFRSLHSNIFKFTLYSYLRYKTFNVIWVINLILLNVEYHFILLINVEY